MNGVIHPFDIQVKLTERTVLTGYEDTPRDPRHRCGKTCDEIKPKPLSRQGREGKPCLRGASGRAGWSVPMRKDMCSRDGASHRGSHAGREARTTWCVQRERRVDPHHIKQADFCTVAPTVGNRGSRASPRVPKCEVSGEGCVRVGGGPAARPRLGACRGLFRTQQC